MSNISFLYSEVTCRCVYFVLNFHDRDHDSKTLLTTVKISYDRVVLFQVYSPDVMNLLTNYLLQEIVHVSELKLN